MRFGNIVLISNNQATDLCKEELMSIKIKDNSSSEGYLELTLSLYDSFVSYPLSWRLLLTGDEGLYRPFLVS